MSRNRSFCFTLNNYHASDDCVLHEFFEESCKYLIVGEEVGENGTPHLQGYFSLKNPKSLSACLSLLDGLSKCPHLEVAKGTASQNKEYCSKAGKFIEWGTCPSSAVETARLNNEHYAEFISLCEQNKLDEAKEKYPKLYLQHHHVALKIRQDKLVPPAALAGVCGEWWWGPPGTGKSHKAFELGCYDKEPNKWFGGYNGTDPIVVQDLDHDNAKWMGYHLKKWADKYPFTAETKGHQTSLRPPKVIVTSNYTIEELYPSDIMLQQAIKRRFKVVHFSNFFNQAQQ